MPRPYVVSPRALVLALASIFACSADPADPSPGSGPAPEPPCGPTPGEAATAGLPSFCVKEVTGTVVSGGRPLTTLPITVCGTACFAGQTDDGGAFRVRVNARLPDGHYTLLVHGRPRHASFFVPLPNMPPERIEFPPIEVPSLSAEGTPLPPDGAAATKVRIGPMELGVPEGTTWTLALEDTVDEVDGRTLRYARVPAATAPRFADGATLVYALAPFEARSSKPISVAFDETGGLPAGTAVEILTMEPFDFGGDGANRSGLPMVAARGHVTPDGTRVETDPGEGVSILTWFAVRIAP